MKNLDLSMRLKELGTQLYGLDIFAQPIISLKEFSNEPHFEILSRFTNHAGTYENPELIFAKQNSPIQLKGLDLIVFEKTFDFLANNKQSLGSNYTAKINASHASIHSYSSFLSSLLKLSNSYKVDPKHITIEINENSDYNIGKFTRSAFSKGFGVSIDDFGAKNWGFLKVLEKVIDNTRESEMENLSIKIDKNCIQHLDVNQKYHKLFEKMIDMAMVLKEIHPALTIIGEGVEDEKTLDYLKRIGMDYGQGYFWAKPMPISEYVNNYLN